MKRFHENMNEYRNQLEKGSIKEAYKGLMDYFNILRLYFKKKYPGYSISGSVYYGFMDMTYFAFFPNSLKTRKLKIAIVFLHEAFRFEVWLTGYNKNVQAKYWKLISDNNWNKHHIVSNINGVDSIIEDVLIKNPDFSDLDKMTKQIEKGTLNFIRNVENFLSNH